MGVGFTLALSLIASIRELVATGALTVWGDLRFALPASPSVVLFILPAGGFITLGLLLALINYLQTRAAVRSGRALPPPLHLDCRSCSICHFGK